MKRNKRRDSKEFSAAVGRAKRNFVGATAAFAEAPRNANSKTRQQHFVFTAPVEPKEGRDR